jgi:DNA-binding IclR family transcriptional regulator
MTAMEDVGAVERNASTKRYKLGLSLLELGKLAYSQVDLRGLTRPILEQLMEKVQETVFLGLLNGQRWIIMDVVESMQDLKITSPIGTSIPLFAAATGKVFLAGMDEKKALNMIKTKGLPRFTDRSVTDPDQYIKEISEVKQKGYAVDDEEYLSGVRAVAAPIEALEGHFVALWVVGFKERLNDDKMDFAALKVKEAAESINQKIRERQSWRA